MPTISVIMPAHNNQETIAGAIQSVLDQTFTDFELIIINDGSSDRTEEIAKQFDDSRIIYQYQPNQGVSRASNRAIELASGKYVALFAPNDICKPERLARQAEFLDETGHKIVFTWVDFIDDDGQSVEDKDTGLGYFNHPQQTRAEMLNRFFFKGNNLCRVTCMAERQLLGEAGLFRPSSAQLSDLWLWGKLVKSVDLAILPEKLVKYRLRAGEGNVTSPHNATQSLFEGLEFSRRLLDDVPVRLFKEAFARHLKNPDFEEGIEYELEKAFLYFQHDFLETRLLGGEKLSNLFLDQDVVEISRSKYGFGLAELFLLTTSLQVSNSLESKKMREDILYLSDGYEELKKYYITLESEYKKVEEYAKSLEPAYQEAQNYLKTLEPAYQESQDNVKKLETAYHETRKRLTQLENIYSRSSPGMEKLFSESPRPIRNKQAGLDKVINDLSAKLEQSLAANQELRTTLARYENDLRQLQATRTVRLSNFLSKPFKKA